MFANKNVFLLLTPPYYSYHHHPSTDFLNLLPVSKLVLSPPSISMPSNHIHCSQINFIKISTDHITAKFETLVVSYCLLISKNFSFLFIVLEYSLPLRAVSSSSGRKNCLCFEEASLPHFCPSAWWETFYYQALGVEYMTSAKPAVHLIPIGHSWGWAYDPSQPTRANGFSSRTILEQTHSSSGLGALMI